MLTFPDMRPWKKRSHWQKLEVTIRPQRSPQLQQDMVSPLSCSIISSYSSTISPAQTPTICCLQLICLSSESAASGYVMWFTKGLKKSSQKGLWDENSWIAIGLKCIKGEFACEKETVRLHLIEDQCCLSTPKDKHNMKFADKKCWRRIQHSSCEPAIKRSCKCFEMLGRALFGSNGGQGWHLQVTNVKLHLLAKVFISSPLVLLPGPYHRFPTWTDQKIDMPDSYMVSEKKKIFFLLNYFNTFKKRTFTTGTQGL